MTLRITIEIVPYGGEKNKYEIGRFDIHNQGIVKPGPFGNDICQYNVEPYSVYQHCGKKEVELMDEFEFSIPAHNRRDGAVELARKVLNNFKGEF